MDTAPLKNAARMMTSAVLKETGIEFRFADGCEGLIPLADALGELERTVQSRVELPNPYEMILQTVNGERIEIPWDFARHYCDESYRPTVEAIAMRGRQTLGERVRRFRASAGLTQEELATAANVGRVTLVRIEHGEQSPRYKTLTALAQALGRGTSELLVDPE